MKFVTESEVVFVVVTCRKVVGPHGVCYREWSGVRCHDLLASGGATWSLLQRVVVSGGRSGPRGVCHGEWSGVHVGTRSRVSGLDLEKEG